MARPTKLNEQTSRQILEAVAVGAYREIAAQAAGITRQTFLNWISRGEEHWQEDISKVPAAERPFVEFFDTLKKAEALAEIDLLNRVRSDPSGWARFMTILERKHPERWGRRDRLEHSGKVEHTHEIDLSKLTDKELQQLKKLQAKIEAK